MDFVSAHGTATVFNDLMEGKALAQVFGDARQRCRSTPSRAPSATPWPRPAPSRRCFAPWFWSGGRIPATTGLSRLDPEIAADVVQGTPREAQVRVAVSTNSGFGGINAAIVLERG